MVDVARTGRVTVRLQGGLGNQLFACATALRHAATLGTSWGAVGTPASPAIGQWVIPEAEANPDTYQEPRFAFTKLPARPVHLMGYFQSARYFADVPPAVLDRLLYVPHHALTAPQAMFQTPYAAWHIRRGDYLTKPDYHPVLPLDYYRKAMSVLKEPLRLIICTDDPEWVKAHVEEPALVIGPTSSPTDALTTLSILRFATVLVMANSSLSWWAAYTAPWARIIFAPDPWFGPTGPKDTSDLYPARCTRLPWDGPRLILPKGHA